MPKDKDEKQTEAEKPAAEKPVDDGLVEVYKDRDTLRVHPTALKEHEQRGWKRA